MTGRPRDRSGPVMGLVLAAGRSKRMGRPKQLLPLHGRPLLQHTIDAAAAARTLATVTIVLGHAADEIAPVLRLPAGDRVRVIVNERYRQGQSTSLHAGIAAASPGTVALAVLLGDQPGVTTEHIDAVVATFRSARTPIVRPTYDDGGPGHPVVLARSVWPAVRALAGDQGARVLITAHPEWLTSVQLRGGAPPDVDTHADYERVRRDAERR